MYKINLNLSEIPKEKIVWSEHNGKKKASAYIIVAQKREPDQYGNDMMVYMSQTEEERKSNAPRVFIGGGKKYDFGNVSTGVPEEKKEEEVNDLPF